LRIAIPSEQPGYPSADSADGNHLQTFQRHRNDRRNVNAGFDGSNDRKQESLRNNQSPGMIRKKTKLNPSNPDFQR